MKPFSIFCTVIMLLSLCLPAAAQEKQTPAQSTAVQVTADRLEVDDTAHKLVFSGNAVANQGGVSISSDRLTVDYSTENHGVKKIVAEGNVRIVQGERVATGQQAVYDKGDERIVLTGSPVVNEGANSVRGHEIILYMNGKRSIVKGGQDSRVRAVFQPGSGDAL